MNNNETLKNFEVTVAQPEELEAAYSANELSIGEEAYTESFRGFLPQNFDENVLRRFAITENES
jgi:hypothetical protein